MNYYTEDYCREAVAALDAKLKEERKRGDDQVRLKSLIWTHIT
jgi:hypothetical protein